jgi:hypothetical protein
MSMVTIFTSNKFLGLVNIGESEPESNTTAGKKGEALSIVIPTIYRISFHGLCIHNNPMLWCESFLKILTVIQDLKESHINSVTWPGNWLS